MRSFKLTLIYMALLCVALLSPLRLAAQEFVPTKVEISTQKAKISGNIYYIHTILKGQTLYSISKAYNVSIEQIKEANPSITQELKIGSILYIPDTSATPTPQSDKTSATSESSATDETMEMKEEVEEAKEMKKYKEYRKRWYEDIEDVAVKHNVTVEAILKLNNLDKNSAKKAKRILIPDQEYMEWFASLQKDAENQEPESHETHSEEDKVENHDIGWSLDKFSSYTPFDKALISVILPFNISDENPGLPEHIGDFLSGVTLATSMLNEDGKLDNIKVNIIDINSYPSHWSMMSSGVLENSDLIIGPISMRDLGPVSDYAARRGIPIVSPLDINTRALLSENEKLYIFPPNPDSGVRRQVLKMKEGNTYPNNDRIVVIFEQGYDESDVVKDCITALNDEGMSYSAFSYNFLDGREMEQTFTSKLDSVNLNKVIIPSYNEAFVTDAIRNLHLVKKTKGYKVELYGLSKWTGFTSLDTDYYHQLNAHFLLPYYVDYNNPETKAMVERYNKTFNTEPTPFAFQGYDIITLFVEAMNRYGMGFEHGLLKDKYNLIQSDVKFIVTGQGCGIENSALRQVEYDRGWTIIVD